MLQNLSRVPETGAVNGKVDLRKVARGLNPKANFDLIVNSGKEMPVTTRAQAKEAGLKYYWDGKPCKKGHYSQRRVSTGSCWACSYLACQETNIRLKAQKKQLRDERKAQKAAYNISWKDRQTFLEDYARHGNIELAARKVKLSVPEIQVQIAKSLDFSTAVVALEKRLRDSGVLAKEKLNIPSANKHYEWDDDKRELFIRVYVDTGDIAQARDSIGITASMYNEEIERNPDFRTQVEEAEPKANQILEERAIQMALRGNDKILTLVLKAKRPEQYGDKIKIEQNTNVRLSDDQLNNKIKLLMDKYKAIEGEVAEDEPTRELESEGARRITHDTRGVGQTEDIQ